MESVRTTHTGMCQTLCTIYYSNKPAVTTYWSLQLVLKTRLAVQMNVLDVHHAVPYKLTISCDHDARRMRQVETLETTD